MRAPIMWLAVWGAEPLDIDDVAWIAHRTTFGRSTPNA